MFKDNLNFPASVIEDLKVRSLVIMKREQKNQYLSSEANIELMKKKVSNLGKTYKEFPGLQISMYTRYCTMEYLFGNPDEEESNLAYSILQSIKKVTIIYISDFICILL